MAARINSRWRPRIADQRSFGRAWARRVEPSMSVKRKVTVPVGLAGTVTGVRSSMMLLVLRYGSEAHGEAAQDRERERGVIEDCLLEVPAREGETTRRLDGNDLCDARQAVQHGQLPEELARTEDCDLLAVSDDPHRDVDHHEEAGPDLALASDHAVGRKLDLDGPFGDSGEVGRIHALEQPARGEQVGSSLVGQGHIVLRTSLMLRLDRRAVNPP